MLKRAFAWLTKRSEYDEAHAARKDARAGREFNFSAGGAFPDPGGGLNTFVEDQMEAWEEKGESEKKEPPPAADDESGAGGWTVRSPPKGKRR